MVLLVQQVQGFPANKSKLLSAFLTIYFFNLQIGSYFNDLKTFMMDSKGIDGVSELKRKSLGL